VARYNGPENKDDAAYDVAVDGSGNVYITGSSDGSGTYDDYLTIKYFQFFCGDVNDDGQINLADPICLAQYYFGKPCEINPWASDVNCDASVNLGDAMIIAKKYFGAPGVELECCE
jgi:hypothetical protein